MASAAAALGGLLIWQTAAGPLSQHAEMVQVFDQFIDAYDKGQTNAVDLLANRYGGMLVNEAEASSALGRETVAQPIVLSNHQVARRYLLMNPYRDCVQTIYGSNGKTTLVVFEHEQEELEWFDKRAVIRAECKGTACSLVQLKNGLAASWRVDTGYVTVMGIRDREELGQLVNELCPR
jgi:hypothetical protein